MPSNKVVEVYNDLIGANHKVIRGSIGIQFSEGLSGAVNRVYGFKNGVLVNEITPDGPAEMAGLKAGDIITAIDGRSIKDGDDLVNEIASRRPGSSIRLGYLREGKQADITVTIGDRDQVLADLGKQPAEMGVDDDKEDAGEAKLGVVVRDLPQATASRLNVAGVEIKSVRAGSFADLQRLEPGLVILRVNKQLTATKEQFNAVVSKLKTGDDVVFEIMDPRHPNNGINYQGGTLQ
jgi:serine protease Do